LELPPNPPTSVTDNTAADIATASGLVEAGVGPDFPAVYKTNTQKFPDIGDNPATPAIIEIATRFYAASLQFKRLGESVGEGEIPQSTKYWDMAEQIVQEIREGVRMVEINGVNLRSSRLSYVEDKLYANRVDPKEFLNKDELDTHWP